MSTPETGRVTARSHRQLFRELTVRSGEFDLRPTAAAWWLKDVTLLVLAASSALTWEGHRDEELVAGAMDVGFRCVASLVSTVLLASLVCPRPGLFRQCFWAHAVCLPGDLSLSATFVFIKAEGMFNSDYTGPEHRSTSGSSPGKAVFGSYVTGTRTEDADRHDDIARLHESRSTAAVKENLSSLSQQNYGHLATVDVELHVSSRRPNESDVHNAVPTKQRVLETRAVDVGTQCNSSSNVAAVSRDSLKGDELAEKNRLRKAATARHQLAVFTLADHIICLFARSYLLMRMRACLTSLASGEVDELSADGTSLQNSSREHALSRSVVNTGYEGYL
ncbi:hypothetical protein HPB51_020210 [Rhipicephalus microplus]|uniref:Uncharacterized protein n=1 Tax=Rhipicephalus microplus TaxID=6941 RepID=A0A9J6DPE9_RHIMP|nr:hypothetical protein HPB51_020210 [Rhipicephalus microplus]